jgi:hypothetical protein
MRWLPVVTAAWLSFWPTSAYPQEREQPSVSELRARFEGAWRLEGTERAARQTIDRAIERAIRPMNFFIRPIARARLREGTFLNHRIELRFIGEDRLSVHFDDRDAHTTPIGRTLMRQRADGERMRVTQRFRPGGQLEQVFQTDSGTRWYVYRPLDDDRMRIETTTHGPRMPEPMLFALEYRRERL